ncbi:S53 family peptidase [Candidatus Kaiserbacteria bacterium]|nr:S53 family peptidase [Candidatus Kaiserbacteria bacterium]
MKRLLIPILAVSVLCTTSVSMADTVNNINLQNANPNQPSTNLNQISLPTPIVNLGSASPTTNTGSVLPPSAPIKINVPTIPNIQNSAGSQGQFEFQPIVPFPLETGPLNGKTCLRDYLNGVFLVAIAVAVSLAVIMIIIDGFKYMTSEAVGKKGEALAGIRSALFGLILLFASYLILYIINPQILTLNVLSPNGSALTGCSSASASNSLSNALSNPSLNTNNTNLGSTNPTIPQNQNTSNQQNPPTTQIPGAGQIYGSGDYCFGVQGGGTECFPTVEECQSAHDSLGNKATSGCVNSNNPTPGNTGNNAGSAYYISAPGGDQTFFYVTLTVTFDDKKGTGSPIRISRQATKTPTGFTPDQIKIAYNLPKTGGTGTIAIIGAYDLTAFSKQFGLPSCTTQNGCFEKHAMGTATKSIDDSWQAETALDVEWAHAIAPSAKILLISGFDSTGANFLKAMDYAIGRADVVAISESWTGWAESSTTDETAWDAHLISPHGVPVFGASGDNGTGVLWPPASPNLIAVGGTSLLLSQTGIITSETAWSGSAGGLSANEAQPSYQKQVVPQSKGKRAVPDVAYDADPNTGFAIYSKGVWRVTGGTSAGAPQWAAISALGGATNLKLYDDAAKSYASYFNDIVSGQNGSCGYYCTARSGYDYVTGLGSPKTIHF